MGIGADSTEKKILGLQYQSLSGWTPLPDWCRSFMTLGVEIARLRRIATRHTLATALPKSDFATVFVALGIVLESTNKSGASREYCDFIRSQPIGTPVVYQSPYAKYRGTIERFFDRNGQPHIEIKLGNRQGLQLSLVDHASRITLGTKEYKLRDYQLGRKGAELSELVRLSVRDPVAFTTLTRLDCVIVTQKSTFQTETANIVLGIETHGRVVSGTSQEILRVEQFVGTTEAYRCQLLASSEDSIASTPPEMENPPVVILSGASAYLRHYPRWPKAHQIVLLDRTEREFQTAVTSLNERYMSRIDSSTSAIPLDLPAGVDAMYFEESIE